MTILSFRLFMLFQAFLLLSSNITLAEEIDLEEGKSIFDNNCAACHAGGQNILKAEKTLEKEVLEVNSMYNVGAIANQVKNGKNQMPAFNGRLSDDDINNVAHYVLHQSNIGW
uniref:Cytochrome c-553 n=1 Tax=Dasya naccarioides TaxID=2007180 RepID=A0A1Z1MGF9_9FLOR|nr:cytochrome c553 [Dasya naccarioides]ARW65093.1 cytochrome c553 [Dasya naccarioides]